VVRAQEGAISQAKNEKGKGDAFGGPFAKEEM